MSTWIALNGYRYYSKTCRNYVSLSSSTSTPIKNHDKLNYSKTVFLPKSNFPSKHDPKVELEIQDEPQFSKLYLEQNPDRTRFIIHDGPPYANGPIHFGHAINKFLKDIAARYAMITGHRVEFVAGWDVHGLPIEMKVLDMLKEQHSGNHSESLSISNEEFCSKARTYARSQIDLQQASFKRMGLLTDWNKRYTTDDPSYIANQFRAFSKLFAQNLVFRDLMPVHWSTINQTTLADADVEYKANHTSRAVFVKFRIVNPPYFSLEGSDSSLHALVWTTTPWTLVSNQCIAFNKNINYTIIEASKTNEAIIDHFLISSESMAHVTDLLKRLGYDCKNKKTLNGKDLVGLKYKSLNFEPDSLNEKVLPFLNANFVEASKGTGLTHISPNHGYDDFELIKQNKIPVDPCLVDKSGNYKSGAGRFLQGKHVLGDGTQESINILNSLNLLVFNEDYEHSYLYETRTNKPVITRTCAQVFLDISRVIPRCLKEIENTSFFPEHRRTNFINCFKQRPNWCLSRQRIWGCPIPVIYSKDDVNQEKMISHPDLIEHYCKLLYKMRFVDFWWNLDIEDLVPQEILDKNKLNYRSKDLVRGRDVFDVWFDSGISWHTTVDSLSDKTNKADLYLEGTDQTRGWFQSSTILSMSLRGVMPTKRFFLHGFVLDENKRKMSKSLGNVVDPAKLFLEYGVDTVRLLAAIYAGDNNDVILKTNALKELTGQINRIRLILKYLIGSLVDLEVTDINLDHTKLEIFDQYFLNRLYLMGSRVKSHYESYRFDLAAMTILRFIDQDLSTNYLTHIKDILYCDELNSKRRESCLTVLNFTYNILLRCLYPLTPHIVHEAAKHMRTVEPLIQWDNLGYSAKWQNNILNGQFTIIFDIRKAINKILAERGVKLITDDAILKLNDKKVFSSISSLMNSNSDMMSNIFKVSSIKLEFDEKLKEPAITMAILDDKKDARMDYQHELSDIDNHHILFGTWLIDSNDGTTRVGGSLKSPSQQVHQFELITKRSDNRRCPRCRKYNVREENTHVCCDRCNKVLETMPDID